MLGVAAFAVGALGVGACGAPEDAGTGASSSDVQGGIADSNRMHSYAVGIATQAGAVCSGTLIAPNLVLTARHCVDVEPQPDSVSCANRFSGKNIDAAQLLVSTEPTLRNANKYYAAREVTTPAALGLCGNDIALITLADNIPVSEAMPAIPVVFPMTDRTRLTGKVAAMGYGITNPSKDDSGVRRIRQNIGLLCLEGDTSLACTSHIASMIDADREFVTEGYVCAGDSGGGAFDQASLVTRTPFVLGALSRGPETTSQCLAAIYSRTDAHARMLVTVAERAATHGGYDPPPWTKLALAPIPSSPPCDTATCAVTDADPAPSSTTSEPSTPDRAAAGASGETTTVVKHACAAAPLGITRSSRTVPPPLAFAALGLGLLAGRRRRARRRQPIAPGA